MSKNAKWVVVGILGLLAVILAVTAIEYLTVPIRNLPHWIPGQHPGWGTYHKRGAAVALVALVLAVLAVWLGIRTYREGLESSGPSDGTADYDAGLATAAASSPADQLDPVDPVGGSPEPEPAPAPGSAGSTPISGSVDAPGAPVGGGGAPGGIPGASAPPAQYASPPPGS